MVRLLRRMLSATVLLVVAVAGVAAPVAGAGEAGDRGSVGIGLLEAPSSRADDPRALVYVIDHLQPGDVIERRIEVTNTATAPIDVALYPAAATIDADGWAPLEGRTANHLTGWTTVTPAATSVPAGGVVEGTIRIAVPSDATPGEHYGVVWAELPPQDRGTVDVVNRVGIRMYVSVGDGAEPASDFRIRAARASTHPDGSRTLDVDVTNVGGRAIDVNGEVILTDGPGGTTAGPFRSPAGPTIAPGGSGVLSLAVPDDLPDGTWTADLTLRSGVLVRQASVDVSWSDPSVTGAVDEGALAAPATPAAPDGSTDRGGDLGSVVASVFAAAVLLAVAGATARIHRRQRAGAVQR